MLKVSMILLTLMSGVASFKLFKQLRKSFVDSIRYNAANNEDFDVINDSKL